MIQQGAVSRAACRRVLFGALVCLAVCIAAGRPATAFVGVLSPEEAGGHIGEQATVCGQVVSTRWANGSNGQPTFLNFGKAFPNHVFTVVIWIEDRPKFGSPERQLLGKNVCVSGKIREYRGNPEIVLRQPWQLLLP